jgi:hypothetical protein
MSCTISSAVALSLYFTVLLSNVRDNSSANYSATFFSVSESSFTPFVTTKAAISLSLIAYSSSVLLGNTLTSSSILLLVGLFIR